MDTLPTLLRMLLAVALLSALGACDQAPAPAARAPLRVAHNLWPGYFPITLAQEKGFFAAQGVTVETVYTEDQQPQIADFYAGKYDGLALPLGSIIIASGNNPDIGVVLAIDESAGGDAVVARPEIGAIAGLRGRVIGATLGGFGELFVERMLASGGLTRDEVTLINADANQIPERLRKGEIQAGQAWEPYVSRAVAEGGRVLYTSAQTPGLIVDVILFRGSVLRERPDEVRAFIRACFQAMDYWQANREEGDAIIADTLGINREDISLEGIRLLSRQDNLALFDPDNPGSLYHNARLYVDFYVRTGSLGRLPDLDTLLVPSLLH